MIHIDRSQVPAPEILTSLNGKGQQERHNNITLMGQNPPKVDLLEFKVYKEDEVRQAINQLFHGKCAYCESTYAPTAPVDVEHYRPKGRIVMGRKKKKPGYYWLAAEWDNLLPSCIDCNRARRQEIPYASPPKQTVGKGDQFPIGDESKRANIPGDEANEANVRLLLNPCLDQPEQHLEFFYDPISQAVLARPRLTHAGEDDAMARESIRVYALQRKGLVDARRDINLSIQFLLSQTEDFLKDWVLDPSEKNKQRIENFLQQLSRYCRDEQPYAGMARQFIGEALQRWKEQYPSYPFP
jgi:uncharacterized protein (TIGR02646 family)